MKKPVKKKESDRITTTTKAKKNKNITSLAFLKNKSNLEQFYAYSSFFETSKTRLSTFLSSKMKKIPG